MAYNIKLFEDYLNLKGLSKRYKQELLYCLLRFNFYGGFNQQTIGDFVLKSKGNNFISRSFITLLKKFLIQYREELQLTEEEYTNIVKAEVPSLSGRKKVRLDNPLTKKEMRLIENTLETEELKLMFFLCYEGGLRLHELIKVKLNSFNWDKMVESPEDSGECRIIGKGNKEGIVFLPNWLMRRIKDYVKNNGSKFKSKGESKLFNVSGRMFEIHLRNAGIKSGISKMGDNGEYIKETIVHPHKLRHQLGHDLMIEGNHIITIKEALRHSNITSTQRYTQLSKEELKKQLEYRNNLREEIIKNE